MSGAREQEPNDLEQDNIDAAAVAQADIEARARRMGWSPKNEFRGDPARWTSAEDFLRRGEEELPIARERARRLDRVVEEMGKELKDARAIMEEMRARDEKRDQRAYERAKAELLAQREEAVRNADTAGFQAIDARMTALEADRAPKPEPRTANANTPQPPAPEIVEWVGRQPWWNRNQEATVVAVTLEQQLTKDHPTMATAERLALVERRIRAAYPEEFPATRRDTPAAVSPSTNGAAPRNRDGKLTFDMLPADERADARKAYAKYKKQMPTFTEEEYLADYMSA